MILDILICMTLIFILQAATPFWWWILIIPFIYSLAVPKSAFRNFFIGAFAGGILWTAYSVYLYCTGSGIIAGRISATTGFNVLLLIAITGAIAFAAAGTGSLGGYFLIRAFRPEGVIQQK